MGIFFFQSEAQSKGIFIFPRNFKVALTEIRLLCLSNTQGHHIVWGKMPRKENASGSCRSGITEPPPFGVFCRNVVGS